MPATVTLSPKYAPLFNLTTRYCMVIGGRGSGKSFAVSTAEVNNSFNEGQVSLFTRFTMTSADISIIPEFVEKSAILGYTSLFHKAYNSITNTASGSSILFRGIKTSSGNQTASLKSIAGVTRWVLDEGEELVSEETFDKIDLSVRKTNADIHVVVVMNPPAEDHFILRRFYKERGVPYDFNGVKGDVTYIHTTYLDNAANLDESFLRLAAECEKNDPEKYRHIFLGFPSAAVKGQIYTNWSPFEKWPTNLETWYGVDFGFTNDPTAIVRIAFDGKRRMYLHEVAYTQGLHNADIARLIKQDYRSMTHVLYDDDDRHIEYVGGAMYEGGKRIDFDQWRTLPENRTIAPIVAKARENVDNVIVPVYCDSAEVKSIAELRFMGISAYKCIKGAGSVGSQIMFVKWFDVFYTSTSAGIADEQAKYRWIERKEDRGGGFGNEPIDAWNHAMDATRYGIFTHLTKQGYIYDDIEGVIAAGTKG